MHINDTHHNQAIALLHEVCEALGIEAENRTREEIRRRLKAAREMADRLSDFPKDFAPTYSEIENVLSLLEAFEKPNSNEPHFSAAYSKTGPGWIDIPSQSEVIGNLLITLAENCDCVTSAHTYFDHDGQTYHVTVREGVRGDENDE